MTEKAEWAKLYVLFRQLSDIHKREILKRAEALAEGRERPETEKKKHGENDDDGGKRLLIEESIVSANRPLDVPCYQGGKHSWRKQG
jgi:hypothetical protein